MWFGRAVSLHSCWPLSWAGKGSCELGPSALCGVPEAEAAQEPTSPWPKVWGRHAGGSPLLALGQMTPSAPLQQ